jgi:hypothetical protein
MKYLPLLFLTLAVLPPPARAAKVAIPPPAPPPILLKPESGGTYQDARGGSHPWSIGQAHGLTWEGQAYLPVGAVFIPLSWTGKGGEEDWAKDKAALDLLGKGGVHDLVLSAGAKGLTHVSPAAAQRVLDYLDANSFHYGLRIADFPHDPLIGYVVKPAVYRNPSPSAAGPTRFRHIPGLADAFYVLVAPKGGEIEDSGAAQITDGETAQVTLKSLVTDDVLLLYPQRLYLAGTPESKLPDLWQGYDEYRDRLLGFFSRVHLGPGFRFFLDPISDGIGFGGEVENVVPTTDGYRLDFEAWLNKKYNHNVDDLNRGWGIKDKDLPDFATAARCLPLWSGGKGAPYVFDPVKKVPYQVLNHPLGGHVWDDLRQFRLESVRGYMNALAGVLKKGVADVPVVYGWGGRSALFSNTQTSGGFDGLSVLDTAAGAYAFAQAEETPKTTWLIAAQSGGSLPATANADWDVLKGAGVRGFFAPAATAEDARRLGQYGAALSFQAQELTSPTRILPYPAGVPGLQIGLRRLPNGVWWLPSYRAGALFGRGDALSLGPLLRAYKLADPDGGRSRFVVWSPHGAQTQASFPFPKDSLVVITDAAGLPLKVEKKKGAWTVPVGADPIVISHVGALPLPADAADAADKEATRLLKLAKDQGLATELYADRLFQIRNTIPTTARDSDLRYNAFAHLVADMTQTLQPFFWLEGEEASSHTFDALISDSEASGGSYLSLDTGRQPQSSTGDAGGYRAEYTFSANSAGSYALWMAGSPPRDSAPFTYTLDGGGANPAEDAPTEGDLYAGKFLWRRLGDVSLSRGRHTLTVTVTGPRDGRYTLAIDAFCLSRVPFHPNGTQFPAIELLPPPVEKDKKGHIIKPKVKDDKDKDEMDPANG